VDSVRSPNPYSPSLAVLEPSPEAADAASAPLATRGQRLGAALLDGLLSVVAYLPVYFGASPGEIAKEGQPVDRLHHVGALGLRGGRERIVVGPSRAWSMKTIWFSAPCGRCRSCPSLRRKTCAFERGRPPASSSRRRGTSGSCAGRSRSRGPSSRCLWRDSGWCIWSGQRGRRRCFFAREPNR